MNAKLHILRAALCVAGYVFVMIGGAQAADVTTVGNWRVAFDEKSATLTLENAARKVALSGSLTFVSEERPWKVTLSRDAALNRLSLVNPNGTSLGYVSFRADGDRLEINLLHRAGANFFPGVLTYAAKATVTQDEDTLSTGGKRRDSFACRTFPQPEEQILNFADGAGDSDLNDSIFVRDEDLAVRFSSMSTCVRTLSDGKYSVRLTADIDDPALAMIAITADPHYYASRWAPGYHPLDRKRCPKAPTGWMSWNTYFDKAGSAENLAEARIGAKFLKPFGLDIWSVESWQDNSLWLPVSSFHHHANRCYAKQFPEGMKYLADEFRKLGFKPGIWMSLYGEGDEEFYKAHKDLYLHDAAGKPINNWAGKYMLDTTNPEALALMTRLARQAKDEWGYEFFKFDGMANTPRKFERPEIRARMKNPNDTKWFENSAKALREGIGDSIFLACMGDFTGTEVKYVDASRLGSDVVGVYCTPAEAYHPLGNNTARHFQQFPVKWKNVLHQAECTFTQIFVNNIMFYTDPDTLMVGYSLEKNEAEVMATIVGLPGQLMFDGDKLASLNYDRMKMIQQVLPVADIHPQNLYPYSASSMIPVWNLAVTRPFDNWRIVALFNFDDAPKDFNVAFEELGMDAKKTYVAYEFWNGLYDDNVAEGVSIDDVPMRSVRLIALREKLERPQFVGDDRHITQGAVELSDLVWNDAKRTYKMVVRAIAGFPFTYFVRTPVGFEKVSTKAEGGKVTVSRREDGLLAVKVEADRTADVTITLQF